MGPRGGLARNGRDVVSRLDFKHLLGRLPSFVRFISFCISCSLEKYCNDFTKTFHCRQIVKISPDCQNHQRGSANRLTSNISGLSSSFLRFDTIMDWEIAHFITLYYSTYFFMTNLSLLLMYLTIYQGQSEIKMIKRKDEQG